MAAALAAPVVAAPTPQPGLRLELRLDGDLRDTVSGRAGTGHGPVTFPAAPGGRCLALGGDEAWVDTGVPLTGLSDTFTVECRVRPAAQQRPYADILGIHSHDFTGFALQQNGAQTNRYYFTYGTGRAWVYTRDIVLAADRWQHVAVVKGRGRLRVYVDGLLVENTTAPEPIKPDPAPMLIGLGIAGQARWFRGQLADVRIWSAERRPAFTGSSAEQAARYAKTLHVDAALSSRWGLFRPTDVRAVSLSVDPEGVPPTVAAIGLRFAACGVSGDAARGPAPVALRRASGFRAEAPLPPGRGYRSVRVTASFAAAGRTWRADAGEFRYTVLAAAPSRMRPPQGGAMPRARAEGGAATPVVSLDGEWLLATDPGNRGRAEGWFRAARPEAKRTKVPWIIQDAFPGYHGVAWYWREFGVPANPHPGGRALLRFEAVDYKADVWLNGQPVGGHAGGETPFTLDVTSAIRPGQTNRVAVRVLNPTHEPIDGMTLNQTPRRAKVIPYSAGASYNHGGIVGSVALAIVPETRIEDVRVVPDPSTGALHIRAAVVNAGATAAVATVEFAVAPAAGGDTLDRRIVRARLKPGSGTVEGALRVDQPRLWALNDPNLYRVTARLVVGGSADERSVRFGFRDFRFEDGCFRLNGKRLFLRTTHTVNATPVGQQVPHDPGLFRRDLVLLKTMGFNGIRFIWGGATPAQLDMCDELGLLVYEEHAASNPMEDSPEMAARFDRSVGETIQRDRNHPSVVIWGLLNETFDGPVFRHAVGMLPLVRALDETRMVMLNSGRWDGQRDIGSICNPGAAGWDTYLGGEGPGGVPSHMTVPGGYCEDMGDVHAYPRVPHTADTIRWLRTLGEGRRPVFLSEYGIGSAVDLWRVTRLFEQMGKPEAEDARYYRERLDRFLADWGRWHLAGVFGEPREFFAESLRKMAGQRTLGLDAIRANPNLAGHSLTGMMDHVNCGEGLFTLFRELKPGTVDALSEALAPLRLCLFAEPAHLYRGGTVRLEAVLADEDALPPGEYPVTLRLFGPDGAPAWEHRASVKVPARRGRQEPPFALSVFSGEAPVTGPAGAWRFTATMERGGAPTGGETVFHVTDAADMPAVSAPVLLAGADAELARWLADHGVAAAPLAEAAPGPGAPILVSGRLAGDASWQDLRARIEAGATAVFLTPDTFRESDDPTAHLPLANRGTLTPVVGWLYLKDEWARRHPIFDGLPAGGLMDYTVYREIIPDLLWMGQDPPEEAVAGAIKASQDYASGLTLSIYRVGKGRIVLNTLRIREELGRHPAAERLLRNMLRWAAGP